MNIPPQIIEFFDSRYVPVNEKAKTVYRIKWRGRIVTTPSGKSVWTTLSGAKNAFNRWKNYYAFAAVWKEAFPETISGNKIPPHTWELIDKSRWPELVHFLQEQKLLEFVKIEE